jgi:hypothetical protein
MQRAALMLVVMACGQQGMAPPDAGTPDAGTPDSGTPDAGVPDAGYTLPAVKYDHSLFWNDGGPQDGPGGLSFAHLMATAAGSGNGGPLLQSWFLGFRYSTYERDQPSQSLNDKFSDAGDPSTWDLTQLPFRVTGVHNRIDKADYRNGGNCGELRASVASTDVTLTPFHMLFIFNQPAGPGDIEPDGSVSCVATARAWADMSLLDGDALQVAMQQAFAQGFTHDRFSLIETVDQSPSPWEWRQWTQQPDPSGVLPFILTNPQMFQQPDLSMMGSLLTDFLNWVETNKADLDARRILIPSQYCAKVVTMNQGQPLVTLAIDGGSQFPHLRQNIELVGCPACHTADSMQFVQTSSERVPSSFYVKELQARATNLESLARGEKPFVPFGPLQPNPTLPP